MTTDQVITGIGAFFAAVAALAAAWSLRYSRATVQIAKEAETLAERTLAEAETSREVAEASRQVAEASRLAAERDRRLVHLLQIAAVVEDIFWEGAERRPRAELMSNADIRWASLRNQLAVLVAGNDGELPACESVCLATGVEHARAQDARIEVVGQIDALRAEHT